MRAGNPPPKVYNVALHTDSQFQLTNFIILQEVSYQGNTCSFLLENDRHSTGVWLPVWRCPGIITRKEC